MFKQVVTHYNALFLLLLAASVQAATPNAPLISWMNAGDSRQNSSVPVRRDMWWGNNGNLWQLKQNGNVVAGGRGGNDSFDPWTDLDITAWPHPLQQSNLPYQNSTGKKVGAYFTEWSIYGQEYHAADIPAQNLTHIYYSFIPVCGSNESLRQINPAGYATLRSQCHGKPDYSVVVHDKSAALEKNYPGDHKDQPIRGIFAELYRLKQTHPHIKILPSVGGWTLSDPLYDIGINPAARAVFIASITDFIRSYDFFDGIDIDWEFPGGGGLNPDLGSEQDGAGFATLMRELRAALDTLSQQTGKSYELTAAMSGGVQKLSLLNWEQAHPYMDYINLMTYDYYGAWSGTPGHQTGLYPSADSAVVGASADEAVRYMLSRGVPAAKIAIGAAMYGRGWQNISGVTENNPFTGTGGGAISGSGEGNIMDYRNIEANFIGGPQANGINGFTVHWDDTAKASYVWNPATNTLISFDTKRSVREKSAYVLQHQLGGIFAWEIAADNGHILNAIHEGLGHTRQRQ